MKLPNGFGSVYKLPGKRRKPWAASKTTGWEINTKTNQAKQVKKAIGYFSTRKEALEALTRYNESPYDLFAKEPTFSDVYEAWSDVHFPTLGGPSSVRTITSAYKHCASLYNIKMKDIRVEHLETTIRNAQVGDSTKARMKSLFNLMYRYAMKHEIVTKDYAQLCDGVQQPKPKIIRVPFSDQEILSLWSHLEIPFADMVLIGIYSGWRPQELAVLKIADIDFENMTFIGGLKTDAGKNRTVPIHPQIMDLVRRNYNQATSMHSEYLFNDPDGQQGTHLTYDKYRNRFKKVMSRLNMTHKPHDTRHTFITKAKESNINEYVLKLIVGHEIQDITEKVYTHRTIEDLRTAMNMITWPEIPSE